MTSNAGAKAIVEPKKLGFATKEDPASDYKKMKQNVMDEVKQIFRPEFLNRIDEIIVFHSLGKEEMKKIVSLLCNQFTKRLESQMNIHLKLRESAKQEGYISLDKRRGAVIAVDVDKLQQLEAMKEQLRIVLARGRCKNISRQEVHGLVDEIFDEYELHENQ